MAKRLEEYSEGFIDFSVLNSLFGITALFVTGLQYRALRRRSVTATGVV